MARAFIISLMAVATFLSFLTIHLQVSASIPIAIETSEPVLKGSRGEQLIEAPEGQNSVISIEVINGFDHPVQVVAIIEVRDSNDISQVIQLREVTVGAQTVVAVAVSWIPSAVGQYQFRTFLISEWHSPEVMSIVRATEITVTHSLSSCKGTASCIMGNVTKIVDGDTIDVGGTRIRLALVNTPEVGEPGYNESKQFTSELCLVGSKVLVDEDDGQTQGSFGRMVAKVTCGDKVLNAELLKAGFGKILQEFCSISEFGNDDWAMKHGC
ncbi:MAG: thermonuclease family protein [Nitrososphaera sp.]